MRKLISFLLALTVILSLLAVPAFASGSGAGVTVEMTSTPTARAGSSVTLTFTVKNPSKLPIAGIEFTVKAADGWGEPTKKEYPCAGSLFDANLVSFDDGVFRATGALNGTYVDAESWDALKLTYNVPEGVEVGTTYTGSVTGGLLYDGQLADQAWGEIGPFTITIVNVKLGDVNDDGHIDTGDATLVAQHAVRSSLLEGNAFAAGDVNGDNVVDTADATLIAQHAVGLYTIE